MIKIYLNFISVCLVAYSLQNEVAEAGSGLLGPEEDTDLNSDSLGNFILYKLMQDVVTLQQQTKAMGKQFEDRSTKQAKEISQLEQRATHLEHNHGVNITCENRKTDWQYDGRGSIVYLDRHHIRCNQHEYLSYFELQRSDPHGRVRYQYGCCLIK